MEVDPPEPPASRAELVGCLHWVADRLHHLALPANGLPAALRLDLLDIVHVIQRLLLREPRRRPRQPRR